mgnify:FL=1
MIFTARTIRCLTFSYFFDQEDKFQNGKLTVDLVSPSNNRLMRTLISVDKNSNLPATDSAGWRQRSIQINERLNYQVICLPVHVVIYKSEKYYQ